MRPDIRPAAASDLSAVADLDGICFGASAWSTVAWTSEFDRLTEDRVILVADDGGVAGYVVLVMPPVEEDVVELLRIAVAPARRRTGIGARLMTAALARCAGRTVMLEVAAGNDSALDLYGGFGFAQLSRRRGYYAGGEDAVIMRWEER